MTKTKILSFILAFLLVFCAIPFSASAAEAEILEINGERLALVTSFGKMNYEGKSRTAFKSLVDAVNALGPEGGKIIFSGNADMTNFKDIEGRKHLTIEGVGTKATGNVLDFTGAGDVELCGDLTLSFLNLRMAKDAFLFTNGFKLETVNEFDTYNESRYTSATKITTITYPDPPSVAPGKSSVGTACVSLNTGTYTYLVAGSANGKEVNGNTLVSLVGGKIENAVAGNVGTGTMNGNAKLIIGDGEITNLVAGSMGGTVNGIITTEINGGKITDTVIGATDGATINGSVVVALNGGTFANSIKAGAGKVTGKKIVITGTSAVAEIANGAADYIVKIEGGFVEPQFEGVALKGFLITDKYGIPATECEINGAKKTSENGVYDLAAGTSTVKVETNVSVIVTKDAKYVAGYEDGTFLPQNNMTRAEAITLLTRVVTDENNIKLVKASYDDVASGAWYEPYIGFFQKLGFLNNITTNNGAAIAPAQNITRSEFAELLYRVADLSPNSSASMKLKSFSDVPSEHPYSAAINYAVSAGVVNGYEDGTFKPENNITRAEVVTMVNRFLGRVPTGTEGATSFSDIGTHWAKDQILAAAGNENTDWTTKAESAKYVLTGNNSEDYIKALYEQSASLDAQAIRDGIDVIAEQMKKDVMNAPNTQEIYADKITQVYYISEKNGSDENDGKTPETAFKTIQGAYKKMRFPTAGTAMLFERGGVYRGQISSSMGKIYGAYGEGAKPILMQSRKNYADESLWVPVEDHPNVWMCTDKLVNVGIMAFDHDIQDYSEAAYDETYGLIMNLRQFGFDGIHELSGDLQFYSVLPNESVSQAGELYLYCEGGNPGKRFSSIEIGEKIDIVDGVGDGCIFDNLSLKFTGGHGIGFGSTENITVTNCIFSWIGGSTLSTDFHGTGRCINYGNAVEVYGSCNNYKVQNCWFYQVYDTAVTHQRSTADGDCIQKNVSYLNNLMELVYWGIEFYNKPAETNPGKYKRQVQNVRSAYNVLRKGGYGWGSIVRHRTCELYSGDTIPDDNSGCSAEYNIFDRAYGDLLRLKENSTEFDNNNIYVQHIGQPLGNLKGTRADCDYNSANSIANLWGDKNAVVIVIDPEKEPIARNIPAALAPTVIE